MSKNAVIEHEGVVIAVKDTNHVQVRIVQSSACSACHAKGLCMAAESKEKVIDCVIQGSGVSNFATKNFIQGSGVSNFATKEDTSLVSPIQVGDKVKVLVQERLGWKAILLGFVLPFIVMMLVVTILTLLHIKEWIVGVSAIAALIPYYTIIWLCKKHIQKQFVFIAEKA